MSASREHVLRCFHEEVRDFMRSRESLITQSKYLSSVERVVILTAMTELQEPLRSSHMASK
jgi:hypothetical protein